MVSRLETKLDQKNNDQLIYETNGENLKDEIDKLKE